METPVDRAGLVAWLRQRVTVAGVDPQLLRLDPRVETDVAPPDPAAYDETALAAWQRREWWLIRCRIAVDLALILETSPPRWLELAAARADRVVEGKQPGEPFVSAWEDLLPLWEDLARVAVREAVAALTVLQGVKVEWTIDQPMSGSLPGC